MTAERYDLYTADAYSDQPNSKKRNLKALIRAIAEGQRADRCGSPTEMIDAAANNYFAALVVDEDGGILYPRGEKAKDALREVRRELCTETDEWPSHTDEWAKLHEAEVNLATVFGDYNTFSAYRSCAVNGRVQSASMIRGRR